MERGADEDGYDTAIKMPVQVEGESECMSRTNRRRGNRELLWDVETEEKNRIALLLKLPACEPAAWAGVASNPSSETRAALGVLHPRALRHLLTLDPPSLLENQTTVRTQTDRRKVARAQVIRSEKALDAIDEVRTLAWELFREYEERSKVMSLAEARSPPTATILQALGWLWNQVRRKMTTARIAGGVARARRDVVARGIDPSAVQQRIVSLRLATLVEALRAAKQEAWSHARVARLISSSARDLKPAPCPGLAERWADSSPSVPKKWVETRLKRWQKRGKAKRVRQHR